MRCGPDLVAFVAEISHCGGMSQTYAPLAGLELPRAPAHQLDDMNDPERQSRLRDSHAEGLRKLQTAIKVALGHGATWAEIRETIDGAIMEDAPGSRLSAIARAKVHGGDDSF